MYNFKRALFFVVLSLSISSFGFWATWTNLTWGDLSYSWNLSAYSKSVKENLLSSIDSGYDKLYLDFQKTWLNLIKTIDYQSLVCLGVLSSESGMFLNMQNEKQLLKKDILRSFADIEIEIATLEEKNRILEKNWVNLFTDGYDVETKSLKKNIDNLVKEQKDKISKYINNYSNQVKSFVQDFSSYKAENKDLISWISDKIFKINQVSENYSGLISKMATLNNLLFASSTFESAVNNIKRIAISNYWKKLDKLIERQIKRYSKLSALESALEDEKQKSLDMYSLSFENSLSKVFGKIYNYDRSVILLDSLKNLQEAYYMRWKFNCQKLLAPDNVLSAKLNLLNKDISVVLASVESWAKLANNTWYTKKFRTDIVSAITNFYKLPSIEAYKTFEKSVSEKTKELSSQNNLENLNQDVSSWVVNNVLPWENILTWVNQNFSFKVPFKLNQKNEDIKVLQQLLIKLSYYSGWVNWIYDNTTLDAVYAFQKANWALKWYENKPSVRWWMWPATRNLLNNYLNK